MGLGVKLSKGTLLLENPCSCGIAPVKDGKVRGGRPPHSTVLHLVSPRWLFLSQKLVHYHLGIPAGSGLKALLGDENEVSLPRNCGALGVAALVDIGTESPVRGSSFCCSPRC